MYKYILTLFLFIIVQIGYTFSQTCYIFDLHCHDTYLRDLTPNTNYGDHLEYRASAWTYQGDPVVVRSVLNFINVNVPFGVSLDSAFLFLYSVDSPTNGHHETLSGSNEAEIYRITSDWEESLVTWNTMPSIDNSVYSFLPMSTSNIQDYKVDVTSIMSE